MRNRNLVIVAAGAAIVAAGAMMVPWQSARLPAMANFLQPAGPAPAAKGQVRAVAVEAALARTTSTADDLVSIGSLQSDESVQIASEIAGRIEEIRFAEGTEVGAGEVLVKLDDVLARAELADAQARLKLAEANLDRAVSLVRTGSTSGKARDEAVANAEIARAAAELARARLAKHAITAPFAGVVGIRKASPGAFVPVGSAIVNLEKIDPVKLSFQLPEVHLAAVRNGQQVEVTVDALPGRSFRGEIYAIDPHVDVNGRALQIRARLPNPDRLLRPGLFARVTVKGAHRRQVVMIPESAIVPRGETTLVYRIEDGKARETAVKLGARRSGEVEVLEGLEADSRVVTAGQLKLRDGAAVEVIALAGRAIED